MIHSLKSKANHPFVSKHIAHLIVPALFFILVVFFYPGSTQFQAGSDEGLNLMKAMLVDKGFALYTEIWSDQPPLFTHILAIGFRIIGYKVGFARYLILGFSLLLVWAMGKTLHMIWGIRISIIGQGLMIFLPTYISLSFSVLIGLPSISFATLSLLALLTWHKRRNYSWLILSALLLSLGILTKIMIGFLGPIFILGLLNESINYKDRKFTLSNLIPAFTFGFLILSILLGAAVFWIRLENLDQLLGVHITASNNEFLKFGSINQYLIKSWGFVTLALIGIYYSIKAKRWVAFYGAAWAVTAYLLLLNHSPIWSHHQLYITIPLIILAAPAAHFAFEKIQVIIKNYGAWKLPPAIQVIATVSVLAILLQLKIPETISFLSPIPTIFHKVEIDEQDQMIMFYMDSYKKQTNWVITDMPIYAFRSRLSVPPELAAISLKRLETGRITEDDIIRVIDRYQPEQVLLWRFYLPSVNEYLEESYTPIYSIGDKKLWILSDIKRIPLNSPKYKDNP